MARKLEVQIVGDTRNFERALNSAGRTSHNFGRAVKIGVGIAAGALIGGLAVAVRKGFGEFAEAQKVTAQTNAVLKSTGGIANVTAKEVDKLAGSLLKKSGVDDEQIKQGANMLLTFTRIRNEVGKGNDIFNQATEATLNLSVAMGKDMQSSAILVGKALNDPIKGMTALSRAGIQFTESQKDTIKAMVESGDQMGAQKIILKELETQFGGSAKAAGQTLPGQLNILKETFMNFAGDIVGRFVPVFVRVSEVVLPAVTRALDALGRFMQNVIGPRIQELANVASSNFGRIRDIATSVFNWFRDHIFPIIRNLREIFVEAVQRIRQVLDANGPELQRIFSRVGAAIEAIAKVAIPILRVAFVEVLPVVLNVAIKAIDLLTGAIEGVIKGVRWLGERAVPIFQDIGKGAARALDPAIDAFRTLAAFIGKVIDGIRWLIEHIPKLPKLPDINPFGGDVRDPRMTLPPGSGTGPASISPRLYDELAGARAHGLTLTSGHRPGAVTKHGTPSDHGVYPSKAIDVSGSAAGMASFFRWLVGQADVKQAFYDPLGSIFGGVLSGYREGGHSDHVHVATYDRGGIVPGFGPQMAVVHGGETILPTHKTNGGLPMQVNLNVDGTTLAKILVDPLRREAQIFQRQNGRAAFS